MFTILSQRPKKQQLRSKQSSQCRLEALEERLALSSLPLAGSPSACTCTFCTGGGAFTTGQQEQPQAFQAAGSKWDQSAPGAPVTITYSYSNLTNGALGGGLPAATIRAAIQEALTRWASVAPLNFVEQADVGPLPSDIDYPAAGKPMLRFGHRPIDGGYNVLAYGYYPGGAGLSGDIQFDTGENWTTNPALGIDLLEVATHEIGHALGLAHEPSASNQAIMNPIYGGRYHGLGTSFLFTDDINGIRSVYGVGTGSVRPLGAAPVPTPPPVPPAPSPLDATITGPATSVMNRAVTVTFTNTVAGQRYAYDFNNDGVWDVGNGTYAGSPSTASTQISSRYLSSPRTLIVRGRVLLEDGRSRDTQVAIVITTQTPVVSLPSSASINLLDRFLITGSVFDNDSRNWTLRVDFGDGTGLQDVARNGNTFTLVHTFGVGGTYTVTVYATDDSGGTGTATMQANVAGIAEDVLFVQNLFRSVLNRPADAGAESAFVGALRNGVPVAMIVATVWNSDEARSNRLAGYYRDILGRAIDPAGQAAWLAQMRVGMKDEDVIQHLIASPEFFNANPQNSDYVRVVFRFVLEREVDSGGLAGWTANLDAGMSRTTMVRLILFSGERQTNLLTQYYRQYLGRNFTQDDYNAWQPGSNPYLTAENLAMAILQSQEFRQRKWWG